MPNEFYHLSKDEENNIINELQFHDMYLNPLLLNGPDIDPSFDYLRDMRKDIVKCFYDKNRISTTFPRQSGITTSILIHSLYQFHTILSIPVKHIYICSNNNLNLADNFLSFNEKSQKYLRPDNSSKHDLEFHDYRNFKCFLHIINETDLLTSYSSVLENTIGFYVDGELKNEKSKEVLKNIRKELFNFCNPTQICHLITEDV